MESGEGGEEPDNYWKKKEAFLRGSTVSLGDKFSSGIFNDASCTVHFLTCGVFQLENLFLYQPAKLVTFSTQRYLPCILHLCIMMKRISLSTNVLLAQQFSSIHHIPSGSSSQMDLNGHSESPVRGLIALLFLQRLTLCSRSISLNCELLEKMFNKVSDVFVFCF